MSIDVEVLTEAMDANWILLINVAELVTIQKSVETSWIAVVRLADVELVVNAPEAR